MLSWWWPCGPQTRAGRTPKTVCEGWGQGQGPGEAAASRPPSSLAETVTQAQTTPWGARVSSHYQPPPTLAQLSFLLTPTPSSGCLCVSCPAGHIKRYRMGEPESFWGLFPPPGLASHLPAANLGKPAEAKRAHGGLNYLPLHMTSTGDAPKKAGIE